MVENDKNEEKQECPVFKINSELALETYKKTSPYPLPVAILLLITYLILVVVFSLIYVLKTGLDLPYAVKRGDYLYYTRNDETGKDEGHIKLPKLLQTFIDIIFDEKKIVGADALVNIDNQEGGDKKDNTKNNENNEKSKRSTGTINPDDNREMNETLSKKNNKGDGGPIVIKKKDIHDWDQNVKWVFTVIEKLTFGNIGPKSKNMSISYLLSINSQLYNDDKYLRDFINNNFQDIPSVIISLNLINILTDIGNNLKLDEELAKELEQSGLPIIDEDIYDLYSDNQELKGTDPVHKDFKNLKLTLAQFYEKGKFDYGATNDFEMKNEEKKSNQTEKNEQKSNEEKENERQQLLEQRQPFEQQQTSQETQPIEKPQISEPTQQPTSEDKSIMEKMKDVVGEKIQNTKNRYLGDVEAKAKLVEKEAEKAIGQDKMVKDENVNSALQEMEKELAKMESTTKKVLLGKIIEYSKKCESNPEMLKKIVMLNTLSNMPNSLMYIFYDTGLKGTGDTWSSLTYYFSKIFNVIIPRYFHSINKLLNYFEFHNLGSLFVFIFNQIKSEKLFKITDQEGSKHNQILNRLKYAESTFDEYIGKKTFKGINNIKLAMLYGYIKYDLNISAIDNLDAMDKFYLKMMSIVISNLKIKNQLIDILNRLYLNNTIVKTYNIDEKEVWYNRYFKKLEMFKKKMIKNKTYNSLISNENNKEDILKVNAMMRMSEAFSVMIDPLEHSCFLSTNKNCSIIATGKSKQQDGGNILNSNQFKFHNIQGVNNFINENLDSFYDKKKNN